MTLLDAIFVAFVLTQLIDYWTTYVIIVKQGGFERQNGLGLTWHLMKWLGTVPGLIVAKGIGLAGGWYLYFYEPSPKILGVLTALYVWQDCENWKRIR